MADARYSGNAVVLADGRVLVVGGIGPGDGPIASAELFTPGGD
jgi:hypothetical protein